MSIKTYPIIGTKSSILWDEKTDAWTYISGQPVSDEDPHAFWEIIPTLFRAADIRASAIANLPWKIMQGETEYETSKDYQNKTGLVSSMFSMLYLIEASLVLAGEAYWKREQNAAGYDKLRHLDPTSMVLDKKKAINGEIAWKRNENGITRDYTPEEIIYFWGLDPYVEIGPPSSWPVKSALNACGVLANMDEFAKNYFGRGAIKAMLFSMSGSSRQTAEEFETWWAKFVTGIQNAFRTKVINADKVEPIIVGEGIKELENVTLSQEKREEIAIALSIPMSILFANAANYATAERDKLNWYEDKIVPEANFIGDILNEQIFEPLGYHLVFLPETLDIFQEDEKERSMALGYLFNAEMPLDIALRVLGFDLTDEQWVRIEKQVAKKEEQSEQLVDQLTDGGDGVAFQPEDPKDKPDPFVEKSTDLQQVRHELSIWQDKCLSAVKKGKAASTVAFIPAAISADVFERVTDGLLMAADDDAVKGVFTSALLDKPDVVSPDDTMKELVKVLKEQNSIAVWKGYP